jgi:hypothetical protein
MNSAVPAIRTANMDRERERKKNTMLEEQGAKGGQAGGVIIHSFRLQEK